MLCEDDPERWRDMSHNECVIADGALDRMREQAMQPYL
jgi:hypothetical protein